MSTLRQRVATGVFAVTTLWLAPGGFAQTAPKSDYRPSSAELSRLQDRREELLAKLRSLDGRVDPTLVADAEVYAQAVGYVLRFPDRFFRADCYGQALEALTEGLNRAGELERKASPWRTARGAVCLGFRSDVDGSIQPCCVWVPPAYDPQRPMRLDVILHGRNATLNEVTFLANGKSGRIVSTEAGRKGEPDCLKLYVFGRGNTSSLWAGETDVFEALAAVRARYNVDPERIVLRGFSMGGSSAWQLGLHYPTRWAAVEVGAGFVQTRPEVLSTIHNSWEFPVLAIHDAANCAVNLTNLPFVAYAGSIDPQRQQHLIVQHNLEAEGYVLAQLPRARFLVGEGVGHSMKPEIKAISDAFIQASLPRSPAAEFRFVAYTPRYGEFGGFQLDSLERLYQRAEIRGTPDHVDTSNVWVLKLDAPRTLTIDGQRVTGSAFQRVAGAWQPGLPAGLRKRAGLQGPIDDAFQESFVCVAPAGGTDPVLEEFRAGFARYLHGEVRVKAPGEVTADDVASRNLILFGDPVSNSWIRKVLPGLPVKWTAEKIEVGTQTFPAAGNTLALIYPNPLNPARYVVLNSGHTFPLKAFDEIHWQLYPRLGDYAVLDRETRAVRLAGFFDRHWQVEH